MFKQTEDLIMGSGVTPESHPAIVGLLELACVRPGFGPGQAKEKKRFQYQWRDVEEAFARCVAKSVTDADLLKLYAIGSHLPPFFYLDYAGGRWKLQRIDVAAVRTVVADALEKAAASVQRNRKSYAIKSLLDLRLARKLNGLDPLESLGSIVKVDKFLVGRGLLLSWMAMGLRIYSALAYNEFGECEARAHSTKRGDALAVLKVGGGK